MRILKRENGRPIIVGLLIGLAVLASACGDDESSSPATTAAPTTAAPTATEAPETVDVTSEAVRLGILAECEGAFGGFHEDVVAGAALAMINHAGATSNSRTTSLEGFSGASVAGVPIELVSVGCGDDTPDRAIQEIRKIVEQDGANVVIGPLSGDESIAVANYAKDHPEVTFLNGIAGAQETTMHVQATNFFRFNGDGAQWNAGVGDILHNQLGWDTAAVIADDYSFGWTSAAGFVAEFCGVGGDVVSRVFPPLGTTDYSSYVQQLPDPDEVDGYFWVVGGTGTQASLEAFVNAKGDLNGTQHAGNLFFNPGLAEALGTNIAGAYVGGFASLPGDIVTPDITAYLDSARDAWDTLAGPMTGMEAGDPAASLSFGFAYGYYSSGMALAKALEAVGGDLSDNHAALRAELANITINPGYGEISLDANRQAIADVAVQQLVLDGDEVVSKTVAIIPAVDQSFGGTFSEDTNPPSRNDPPCETRDLPWVGNAIPVVDGVPMAGEKLDVTSEAVRLGILAECEGAFGGFHEDVVAGAALAMINHAGATSNSRTTSLEGFSGASVAGVPIELVSVGCGDDTPDRAIQEIRKIVEQDGANVVIGPLSGDESIAVANYAKDHPEVTFLNGIAGAQETTMHVQATNFFRFNGDGAQWNAGVGDILHNQLGWDTAAVIADDYSFGWTSAAGFVAEFCGVGGDVVSRVFPPLGTTDYSSYVQQLPDPDEVDGYFWVVGGTGTQASLEAFVNAKGDLNGTQHAGNLFFNPGLAEALGTNIAGAYVGGFASLPGDIVTPDITAYLDSARDAWDTLAGPMTGMEAGDPAASLSFGFAYGYYSSGMALAKALEAVGGDLSDNHAALRAELANITINPGYGEISLDANRQAIADVAVQQLVLDGDEVVSKTVAIIPAVDQSFGGTFSEDTNPPSRNDPPCETRDLPWVGNAIPVVDGVPQR